MAVRVCLVILFASELAIVVER